MKIVILDKCTVTKGDVDLSVLERLGTVEYYDIISKPEMINALQGADAVVCNKSVVNREVMDATQLKFVGVFATGYNNIDVEYAKKKGLRIALENTRGADWLVKTLEHFEGCDTVGFCYDSGHEAFCTPGFRFLPQIGHRLIYTHLHDNLIVGDHHLLPWEGKIGFDRVVGELRDCGYQGSLTLELNYTPYADKLSPEDYVKRCYDIACRLAEQLDR